MSKGSMSICQMLTKEDKEGCCICCWWRTCPWRWLWGWTCWIWGTCWAGSIEGCDWVWDCWTDGLCCCFCCSCNVNSSGFSHCRLVPVNVSSTGIIKIAKTMATHKFLPDFHQWHYYSSTWSPQEIYVLSNYIWQEPCSGLLLVRQN